MAPKLLGQCVYKCVILSICQVLGTIQGPLKICTSVCQVKMNDQFRVIQKSHLTKMFLVPINPKIGILIRATYFHKQKYNCRNINVVFINLSNLPLVILLITGLVQVTVSHLDFYFSFLTNFPTLNYLPYRTLSAKVSCKVILNPLPKILIWFLIAHTSYQDP